MTEPNDPYNEVKTLVGKIDKAAMGKNISKEKPKKMVKKAKKATPSESR
jgi:hypothetical protein